MDKQKKMREKRLRAALTESEVKREAAEDKYNALKEHFTRDFPFIISNMRECEEKEILKRYHSSIKQFIKDLD